MSTLSSCGGSTSDSKKKDQKKIDPIIAIEDIASEADLKKEIEEAERLNFKSEANFDEILEKSIVYNFKTSTYLFSSLQQMSELFESSSEKRCLGQREYVFKSFGANEEQHTDEYSSMEYLKKQRDEIVENNLIDNECFFEDSYSENDGVEFTTKSYSYNEVMGLLHNLCFTNRSDEWDEDGEVLEDTCFLYKSSNYIYVKLTQLSSNVITSDDGQTLAVQGFNNSIVKVSRSDFRLMTKFENSGFIYDDKVVLRFLNASKTTLIDDVELLSDFSDFPYISSKTIFGMY
jgi:hypothetical protein